MTSIFTFATALKEARPAEAAAIDARLALNNMVAASMTAFALTETYEPFTNSVLPMYTTVVTGIPVTVRNTGEREGDEVAQVYLADKVSSVSPPRLALKAFERVTLQAGESRTLSFSLGPESFGFYDRDARWTVEPGAMTVQVGPSSASGLRADFELVGPARAGILPAASARARLGR